MDSQRASAYSPLKVFHHRDRLDQLANGEQIVPTQVQLIISDLCNQDCGFCLAEDSLIDTIHGKVPISQIAVDDRVLDLYGEISHVTQTSERRVSAVYEISAGGQTIRCSAEHPVFTVNGIKKASEVTIADTAIMCLRRDGTNFSIQQSELALFSDSLRRFENVQTQNFEIGTVFHQDGVQWCLETRKVDSVRRLEGEWRVFNFSCKPNETYIANGFGVHNCAYRMSGYSSNQLFTVDSELASFGHDNPKRMIEYPKIIEILNDCANMGVRAIQLTGGGEPSVHPRFVDVCDAVLDRGLDLGLVTNGVVMKPGALEALIRAKWVRVSIDAGTPETYTLVRRVGRGMWRQAWRNIESLTQARDQHDARELFVGVGFVTTKDNFKEVAQCAKLAREAGADNFRISAVFQPDDEEYFEPFYEEALDYMREARELQTDTFKVFDNFGDRVGDLRQHSPDYHYCGYQEFNTYIGGDLNVYRCCVLAYNERGVIGSLKEQTFQQLWESEQKQKDFATFNATKCERCQFNNKNRTILYALDPDPQHVNFV